MENNYDISSEDYVSAGKKFFGENPKAGKTTEYMLDKIKPLLKGAYIADIGCGDAPNLDFYITNKVQHVSLIDPSENMLNIAKRKVESDVIEAEKVAFCIGTFEKNNLKDESVDLIISRFSLHYNDNLDRVFENIHKKLKKDGEFFALVPHPDDKINHILFQKDEEEYIRIKLYESFIVEYPSHTIEEYFSPFVLKNFKIIENKTFTNAELGLKYVQTENAVLFIQLRKK